jgi:hypothetical protein
MTRCWRGLVKTGERDGLVKTNASIERLVKTKASQR